MDSEWVLSPVRHPGAVTPEGVYPGRDPALFHHLSGFRLALRLAGMTTRLNRFG